MAQGQTLQQQLLYTKCLLSYCPGHTTLLWHALFSFSQVLVQVGDLYTISGEHRHQTTFVGVVMEIIAYKTSLLAKVDGFTKCERTGGALMRRDSFHQLTGKVQLYSQPAHREELQFSILSLPSASNIYYLMIVMFVWLQSTDSMLR